ncbi:transmembrane protein 107 isoform X1 [Paroedura picta]|uniref:transmembrane protein 107 isoform X1 n=2 Tax=Paroedura picta TaxID=143630 RepID=UPI00405722F5
MLLFHIWKGGERQTARGQKMRCEQDSNLRRESPLDFKSNALTTRPSQLDAQGVLHRLGARRMPLVNGLVPSRFLTLTAHLVIVITIFWSRENNVRASLPLQCTQQEYEKQDTEMVVALSVTLGLFAVELAGFLSGVSMFNNLQSLLSTGAHASAVIALLFFLFEQWDGSQYWWIFAFCSALPAAVEVLLFISVFGLKKKPL